MLPVKAETGIERVVSDADYANSLELVGKYKEIVAPIGEFYEEAMGITVTARGQGEKEGRAGQLLKQTNQVYKALEEHRKAVKADFKKAVDVIDGTARVIKQDYIEPLMAHLKKQEQFTFLLDEHERRERVATRTAQVEALGFIPANYSSAIFGQESSEAFDTLIADLRKVVADREEAERLRVEAEKIERERIRLENERLREAAIAQQAVIDAERLQREASERTLRAEIEKAKEEAKEAARKAEIEKAVAVAEAAAIASIPVTPAAQVDYVEGVKGPIANVTNTATADASLVLGYLRELHNVRTPHVHSEEAQRFVGEIVWRITHGIKQWSAPNDSTPADNSDCPF